MYTNRKYPLRSRCANPQNCLEPMLNSFLIYLVQICHASHHVFMIYYSELTYCSGHIRRGSGGSADPPKIVEPVGKKLDIHVLSKISSIPIPLGQKLGILIPQGEIPNVATVLCQNIASFLSNLGNDLSSGCLKMQLSSCRKFRPQTHWAPAQGALAFWSEQLRDHKPRGSSPGNTLPRLFPLLY